MSVPLPETTPFRVWLPGLLKTSEPLLVIALDVDKLPERLTERHAGVNLVANKLHVVQAKLDVPLLLLGRQWLNFLLD